MAVIVNVTLYFVALAVKLKCECYIADISLKITLDMLIKYATMQFVVAIRKIVAFVMFIYVFNITFPSYPPPYTDLLIIPPCILINTFSKTSPA